MSAHRKEGERHVDGKERVRDGPISLKFETIIDSRFAFSSACILRIPRFSSALMTWFSFRIRTAFILELMTNGQRWSE